MLTHKFGCASLRDGSNVTDGCFAADDLFAEAAAHLSLHSSPWPSCHLQYRHLQNKRPSRAFEKAMHILKYIPQARTGMSSRGVSTRDRALILHAVALQLGPGRWNARGEEQTHRGGRVSSGRLFCKHQFDVIAPLCIALHGSAYFLVLLLTRGGQEWPRAERRATSPTAPFRLQPFLAAPSP